MTVDLIAVRDAIAEGELDTALSVLKNGLNGHKLHDEVLLHSFQSRDLGRRERKGLISAEDARVARMRLASALLELASVVERARHDMSRAPLTDPLPDKNALEKLFGVSKMQPTYWLEEGLRAAHSVCRIVTPSAFGSGFVIAQGVITTNYHVIASPAHAAASMAEMNYEEDARGNLRKVARYRLDAASYRADPEKDVVICRMVPTAGEAPFDSYAPLPLHFDPPNVADDVSIIQHPEGRTKQVAFTANPVVALYEHRLQYLTQTLPGSSGSPVFDTKWRVVAIHRAGGYLVTNANGDRRLVNEGVLACHIAALLA
jgi:V8-like Glu-specific endopeptidase